MVNYNTYVTTFCNVMKTRVFILFSALNKEDDEHQETNDKYHVKREGGHQHI
jgi:hypothetical protein